MLQTLALWSGWVLGPVAWGLHLMGSYLLVEWVCRSGELWVLHGVTMTTLLMALAGVVLDWRSWSAAGRHWPASRNETSTRLIAVVGLLVSLLSAVVILAEGIPNFIVDPCL